MNTNQRNTLALVDSILKVPRESIKKKTAMLLQSTLYTNHTNNKTSRHIIVTSASHSEGLPSFDHSFSETSCSETFCSEVTGKTSMQHPVGAVVACSWPWMGRMDQVGSVGVLSFLGGGMGRDSTFPNNWENKKVKVLMWKKYHQRHLVKYHFFGS